MKQSKDEIKKGITPKDEINNEAITKSMELTGKIFTNKKRTSINIQVFDFKRPAKFSKDQFRILEIIYNSFARIAETNLSVQLRTLAEIRIMSIEQKTFEEYIDSLPSPCYLNMLGSSAFKGDTVLQFENKLIFIILDRLLGGKGDEIANREFTDIEINIVQGIIAEFLVALQEAWLNIVELSFRVKSEETNPQFVRVIPLSEMCSIIEFEMKIGNKEGKFTFCLPFMAIESVLGKLTTRRWFAESEDDNKAAGNKKHVLENLREADVPASIILGEAIISLKDLTLLEKGDVIKLEQNINRDLVLTIEGNKIFKVQAGKIGKNLAVQITEVPYSN
jgi:flagellar motor switch protein FliM